MAWEQVFNIGSYQCSYVDGFSYPLPSEPRGRTYFRPGNTPTCFNFMPGAVTYFDNTWTISPTFYCVTKHDSTTNNYGFCRVYDSQNDRWLENGWSGLAFTSYQGDLVFYINHDLQEADVYFCTSLDGLDFSHFGSGSSNPRFRSLLYNEIMNQIEPTYQWVSIKSLRLQDSSEYSDYSPYWSGGDGMLLSFIPDEALANLDVNIPRTNQRDFVIKPPSFEDVMIDFNDTTVTKRIFVLSNGNYCLVGVQSGLLSHTYSLEFVDTQGGTPVTLLSPSFSTLGAVPYLGFLIDEENEAVQLNIIFLHYDYDSATGKTTGLVDYNTMVLSKTDRENLYTWIYGSEGYDEESEQDEENPEQGGDTHDPVINVPLNRPGLPSKGAVGSGFVSLFKIEPAELQSLAQFMWDDSLITNLGRLFGDPRQILVGLGVFPISPNPSDVTSGVEIKAGNLNTGIFSTRLNTEYRTRYAGYCRVPVGDSDFFSFAPYRRIKLVIPYCGEHEIDPSAVYGKKLELYYHFSFFSGACVCEVDRDGEPFLFFGGQMGFQIPMSSEDYTRVISSVISSGAAIGAMMATGGASAAAAKTQTAANLIKTKSGIESAKEAIGLLNGGMSPNVSYNSGGGSTNGFLSSQQPYLVVESSIPAYDGSQKNFIGNAYYKVRNLGSCTGYVKCFNVHVHNSIATGEELKEIDALLKEGVVIGTNGSPTPSDTPSVSGNTVITFMKNKSDFNVISKKWDNLYNIEGKLLYDNSISTPIIQVEGNLIGYNYCYIGLFHRFYYIDDVRVVRNNLTEAHLHVDVLQSFKDNILDSDAAIERYQGKGNKFIEDPYIWTENKRDVATLPFYESGIPFDFDHQEDCYILTIAGG